MIVTGHVRVDYSRVFAGASREYERAKREHKRRDYAELEFLFHTVMPPCP